MFAKPFPPEKLANVGADGFVSAADVTFLRRMVFKDGILSPAELDGLFTLGERAEKGDPEWGQFFEEAACDFYLNEEEPKGYFTAAEFQTLKARVTKDGATASVLELRLMVKLLECANDAPAEMRSFVVEQMRARFAREGVADKATVELLRRFVFSAGGDGNINVTRQEAELLLDLNDAGAGADDPAWADFFVKSLAAHLMAESGYKPMSQEDAKRLHSFVSDHKVNLGGVFSKMLSGGLAGFKKDPPSTQKARNAEREAAIAQAEQVTTAESEWLAERIGRDGKLHANERALLAYVEGLGAQLPERLKALARAA